MNNQIVHDYKEISRQVHMEIQEVNEEEEESDLID